MDDENTSDLPMESNIGNPILAEGESVSGLRRRIIELETALSRMTQQRNETRRMLFEIHAIAFPEDRPPTEEELVEERKTLIEKSISRLIDELETDVGVAGS